MSLPIRRYLGSLLQFPHLQHTLLQHQVPRVLHEPGIKSGYRPMGKNWSYYIISAFQVHNETGNIWTHGLAVFVYLFYMASLPWELDFNNPAYIGVFCQCFGLVVNAMCSCIAHLFHSKSVFLHHVFFMVDYIGISMYGLCMGVAVFCCSGTPAFYRTWGQIFLLLNALSSFTLYGTLMVSKICFHGWKSKLLKVAACLGHVIFLSTPLCYRLWDWLVTHEGNGDNLGMHLIYYVSAAFAAFFYSAHLPERMFPGKFDVIGHGHQWFHIAVVFTGINQMKVAFMDNQWQSPESKLYMAQIHIPYLIALVLVTIVWEVILTFFMSKMIDREHENIQKTDHLKEE